MLSEILKETLQHAGRFVTLSLVITMLHKCLAELLRLGITKETCSFLILTIDKINKELEEGHVFLKEKEDFNKIVEDFNKGEK